MQTDPLLASLFSFLSSSPTAFHATDQLQRRLVTAGFFELSEGQPWNLQQGDKAFIVRHGALIALSLSRSTPLTEGLRIIGAHTDSPSLQIKPNLRTGASSYLRAAVEPYGGALLNSWFDRNLSLAGRVCYQSADGATGSALVDLVKPVVCLPSLAIHLNRKANEGREINAHNDLCPILGCTTSASGPKTLQELLLHHLSDRNPEMDVKQILGFDLFCYDIDKPLFCGLNEEFIAAPRLDNLLSCHCGVEALCEHDGQTNCMLICLNHEEIGSTSLSGALGNFPEAVLLRLLPTAEQRGICLHRSVLLSLDNAHATHPNFHDTTDSDHEILLNYGPVIKINAAQRYSTTAKTAAMIRVIAQETGCRTQDFVMRGDMPCGSTIGPLSSARLGVEAVDIGAATWGMHAIREMTGRQDPSLLFQTVRHFLNRPQLPHFTGR